MKLAFDHQIFSLQTYGGISRYFVRLVAELQKIPKAEAKIFAGFYINKYLREQPTIQTVGVGIDQFPWRFRKQMPGLNLKFSSACMHFWRPDVIHETYYSETPAGPVNVPRIVTVYDMIHELFTEKFSPDDQTSKFKRVSVQRADHVICISQSTKDDLIRLFGTPSEKISVIYLGCESATPVSVHPVLPKWDRPYLLYVGERGGYKNFSGMLKSVANSQSLKREFRIICFGGGALRPRETELIHSLGFESDQVMQVGGDDEKLSTLYEQAVAFVYPSMYEGFGLPPLEAMVHGCPVITSQTSSMPEVVGCAGEYFDPHDIDSIAEAIENVVSHPTRRSELIALGRNRINMFSWAQCAEKTQKVYEKLC